MDLNKSLNEFCYYFTRYFEEQIRYWRHILEENPDLKKKSNSKPISFLASLSSAIPTVGKGIGSGITEGEKYINNLIDKDKASSVSTIAYASNDNKDLFRNKLIAGALEFFIHFEYQFTKVKCKNGGITRAMQKLGQDCSNRLFTYLLNEESGAELTSELIQKGILYGDSKRHKTKLLKLGRTIYVDENSKLTTSDFITNCGIRMKHDDVFTYYKTKASIPVLGHRTCFHFETSLDNYEIESPKYFYNYILTELNTQQLLKTIFSYISKKDPLEDIKEFAKFNYEEQVKLLEAASEERHRIREEILGDNATKHVEVKETIESSQITIINRIENVIAENTCLILSQTDKVLQKNEELSRDVADIKSKQDQLETNPIISVDLNKIKEQTTRLKENIEREGKKAEQEIRRFKDRIGKIRL
nr:uncharacterized protein LOC111425107 [Onthophagus taurus]